MRRLQRPPVGPLPLRRAFAARLRRVDVRTSIRRVTVGVSLLLLLNIGLGWRSTIDGLGQRREIATMLRSVPAGSTITAADVAMSAWPLALVPGGSSEHLPIGDIASSNLVAGEAVITQRLFPGPDGIAAEERLVTVPQPLAPPPLRRGTAVELYGILAIGDGFLSPARRLTHGVVFDVSEQSVAIIIDNAAVPTVIEHLAFGTIDLVIRP